MNTIFSRNLILAGLLVSVSGFLAIETSSVANAKDKTCRLDRHGHATRSCQCEILTNERASPRMLNRLSALKVCGGFVFQTSQSDKVGRERPRDPPPPPPPPPPKECDQPQMGDDSHYGKGDREADSTQPQ